MKRRILGLLFLLFSTLLSAQGYIGFRDTRYIYGGYQFKSGIHLEAEHSIYSDHFAYQRFRMYVGYNHEWKYAGIDAKLYGSTLWNGYYQDAGLLLKGAVKPIKILWLDATLNPHYDTGDGYHTNYAVGAGVKVYREIALHAHYTTIPEYRISEKRVRVGISFNVMHLFIQPEISIPVDGQTKNARVLFTMKYTIPNSKNNTDSNE